jgi:hypothetical protein
MLIIKQLREEVVRPLLRYLEMWSQEAENLVIGTALVESVVGEEMALKQLGRGPALGIFQMEPMTHDDIWDNWLMRRPDAAQRVRYLAGTGQWLTGNRPNLPDTPVNARELVGNLNYAAAMCRIHYRRIAAPLPPAGNVEALGQYYKRYYNTYLGKGSVEEYVKRYKAFGE